MRYLIGLWMVALTIAAAGDKLDDVRAQLNAGHPDAAIELLRGQLATDPGAVEPSILLSQLLLSREGFDEAGEVIDNALVKHPDQPNLQRVLGDLRFREGRIYDAEKAYKAAIKLDPQNARAIYGISRVFQASCLRKKAAEMLQVAHAIDSHDLTIAATFFAADRRSQAAIARMDAELASRRAAADAKGDSSYDRALARWIAEAKALGGKPEFDVPAPADHYRIPLTRVMDGRRVTGASLALQINGAKADLRFDTGASGIVVSSRFAERAGLQHLGDTEISGIGNGPDVKGWVGYTPKIKIGNLEFANCIVSVSGKGSVDDSGGLIGAEIFRRFLVTINFATQSLDLDPLPGPAWDGHALVNRYDGPELAAYSQVLIVQHDLLVPTLISESTKKEQTAGLFLLDTGSTLNMISTHLAPAITSVHGSLDRVTGISGKVKNLYEADKVILQFASFRQLNLDLRSFDLGGLSRDNGMEVSGIMGLPLIAMFEAVTLDYRDGRVKFDYRK